MYTSISRVSAVVSTAVFGGLWCLAAMGQDRENQTRDDAVLIVDGIVREVFRSPRQDRLDYLVEIEVKRTQADRVPRTPPRVATPAPGDIVYVHASDRLANGQGQGIAGQNQPSVDSRQVRSGRAVIRACLPRAGRRGGWEGAGSNWFEITSNVLAEANPADSPAAAPGNGAGRGPATRTDNTAGRRQISPGITWFTGESLNVKGQFVLRVSSVEQGGPAQRWGSSLATS